MLAFSKNKIRFNPMELSGALGDLGLFIPLVVAVCITCQLDIGIVLILAGLMNVMTGLLFGQPIPVQPMKALAAVVIAEGLLKEELMAAGILMGVILIVLSLSITQIHRYVPPVVVRGIQLGIGIKLIVTGAGWIGDLSFIGLNSITVAAVVICLIFFSTRFKWPVLLFIFILGFLLLRFDHPEVFVHYTFALPRFEFYLPRSTAWVNGFLHGVVPQLPLTLLNSVVAVCALSEDYFPSRGVKPRPMAFSVGLMNLICVPLGAIPMCHGAGGLAAQYKFGARTAGSVIFLGVLKIIVGFVFGGMLLGILSFYPMAVLGPMLIFAGFELAKSIKHVKESPKLIFIAIIIACCIMVFNTAIGFLAGMILVILLKEFKMKETHL